MSSGDDQVRTLAVSTLLTMMIRNKASLSIKIYSLGRIATRSVEEKICQYGGYCRMDDDCVAGNMCIVSNSYYSQYVPDPVSYADPSTGCVRQYGSCSKTTACCDPGAICSSYGQCVQPHSPDCVYPSGFPDFASKPGQLGGSFTLEVSTNSDFFCIISTFLTTTIF